MTSKSVLDFVEVIKSNIKNFDFQPKVEEYGVVVSIYDGVAKIYGLENVCIGELVEFESGAEGMALNLNTDSVDVVLFASDDKVEEGMKVNRTNKSVNVPVGKELLGRVVDALGNPIDGKGPINAKNFNMIERMAPRSSKSLTSPAMFDCFCPIATYIEYILSFSAQCSFALA